jgi:hypothetical protein
MPSDDPKPLIEQFNNPPRFADRVVELRRVKASELLQNPLNWRRHPESQSAALEGMLADVGFADAVIARETDKGLELSRWTSTSRNHARRRDTRLGGRHQRR